MPVPKKLKESYNPSKPKASFRPRKPSKPPQPKRNALNSLNTRIRDLKRLLSHTSNGLNYKMPADVRLLRERELQSCEHELAEKKATAEAEARKQKMIAKYHQVRFFDRQKANRALKKIRRELDAAEERGEKDELLLKLHNAEVDLNYALYYPLSQPYSSLFPRSKNEEAKLRKLDPNSDAEESGAKDKRSQDAEPARMTKGNPEMWKTVENAMKHGTLEALRNSQAPETAPRPTPPDREKVHKQGNRGKPKNQSSGIMKKMLSETKVACHNEDDSDGGFFE
ncbi:hypothetical protein K432DRAFT_299055 [Lepidopterella palustris CBS 459.81]|uniref:rRNA-processing protein EFG1 n=1 Tax=Lepidopterella palustris CBS 459.81 TaxID=1314670 RepID=A0A8E2E995_9PEZI|nr:hypothetical protein K432DRAFT_299055 [Lepidopterella palustris CBS 459.81]